MSIAADYLAKLSLLFFGLIFWKRKLSLIAIALMTLAWLLDGGYYQVIKLLKEPFIRAMLILCCVVMVGICWSENRYYGLEILQRYISFLIFIPYFGLLNRDRLPWAIAGILISFIFLSSAGAYLIAVLETQDFRPIKLQYLTYSTILGTGVLVFTYLANIATKKKWIVAAYLVVLFVMMLQFNVNGRTPLIATLISQSLMLLMFYREKLIQSVPIFAGLFFAVTIFTITSGVVSERAGNLISDIQLLEQGEYNTSLGYRVANIDVAVDGILNNPIIGLGTGMSPAYFDEQIPTYKNGLYKDLTGSYEKHGSYYHYHNDILDIGLNTGFIGILAWIFLMYCWYLTIKNAGLPIAATSLLCYVLLVGQTNVLVTERKALFSMLMITAILITWSKTRSNKRESTV